MNFLQPPTFFHALADAEPGTFYLTDFLVRHFDRLVIEDLKLNTHPTLRDTLFAHYTRVVYLAQTEDASLVAGAQRAADQLALPLEVIQTGLGDLQSGDDGAGPALAGQTQKRRASPLYRGWPMQRIDILWRDIPSQVLIKRGRERGKYMLSARFQEAIDRAAMRAGKGGSDAYLDEWRRVTTSIEAEGALEDIAQRLGEEIESQVSDEQLAVLVKQKGSAEVSGMKTVRLWSVRNAGWLKKCYVGTGRHPRPFQPSAKSHRP